MSRKQKKKSKQSRVSLKSQTDKDFIIFKEGMVASDDSEVLVTELDPKSIIHSICKTRTAFGEPEEDMEPADYETFEEDTKKVFNLAYDSKNDVLNYGAMASYYGQHLLLSTASETDLIFILKTLEQWIKSKKLMNTMAGIFAFLLRRLDDTLDQLKVHHNQLLIADSQIRNLNQINKELSSKMENGKLKLAEEIINTFKQSRFKTAPSETQGFTIYPSQQKWLPKKKTNYREIQPDEKLEDYEEISSSYESQEQSEKLEKPESPNEYIQVQNATLSKLRKRLRFIAYYYNIPKLKKMVTEISKMKQKAKESIYTKTLLDLKKELKEMKTMLLK